MEINGFFNLMAILAFLFLKTFKKYLIIKRKQAELALTFLSRQMNGQIDKSIIKKIKEANSRSLMK
jgi:hypothetical protein